jgi:protein arginine N-methyltransferase 5
MSEKLLLLGYEPPHVTDLPTSLYNTQNEGFNFIVAPLAHPRNRHRFASTSSSSTSSSSSSSSEPFTRSDLVLSSSYWTTSVVGKTSTWIDPDDEDVSSRTQAAKVK